MSASFPDRQFQLWEYRVAHGSLLVRSPRRSEVETNVDLIFVGVDFLSVPRHLAGVQVLRGGAEDVARAVAASGRAVDPAHVVVLSSAGRRHLVVAAAHCVREHTDDIFTSPFV